MMTIKHVKMQPSHSERLTEMRNLEAQRVTRLSPGLMEESKLDKFDKDDCFLFSPALSPTNLEGATIQLTQGGSTARSKD